jgi:hypothetical protein
MGKNLAFENTITMEELIWSHAVIKRHESFSLDGKDVCGMDGMDNVLEVDVREEV